VRNLQYTAPNRERNQATAPRSPVVVRTVSVDNFVMIASENLIVFVDDVILLFMKPAVVR